MFLPVRGSCSVLTVGSLLAICRSGKLGRCCILRSVRKGREISLIVCIFNTKMLVNVVKPNVTSQPFLLYCRSWQQLPHSGAFCGSNFPTVQVIWLSSLYISQSSFVSLTWCHWCHRCNNQPWSTTWWLFLQLTFTAHLFQQAWKWEDEAG